MTFGQLQAGHSSREVVRALNTNCQSVDRIRQCYPASGDVNDLPCFFRNSNAITSQTFVMSVIPMMVFGSNNLGGEFSQLDSLITHALVGIPGFAGTPCSNCCVLIHLKITF